MRFFLQASHEDEDEGVMECQSRVRAVLGEKHDALYPKVLQLVMADGAYCEGTFTYSFSKQANAYRTSRCSICS